MLSDKIESAKSLLNVASERKKREEADWMKIKHKFLLGITNIIMSPPTVVKIALRKVNHSEVGRRSGKFYCGYAECKFMWNI